MDVRFYCCRASVHTVSVYISLHLAQHLLGFGMDVSRLVWPDRRIGLGRSDLTVYYTYPFTKYTGTRYLAVLFRSMLSDGVPLRLIPCSGTPRPVLSHPVSSMPSCSALFRPAPCCPVQPHPIPSHPIRTHPIPWRGGRSGLLTRRAAGGGETRGQS